MNKGSCHCQYCLLVNHPADLLPWRPGAGELATMSRPAGQQTCCSNSGNSSSSSGSSRNNKHSPGVPHVGRLHENKQQERRKRCRCKDWIFNFVKLRVCANSHMASCRQMLATKNTLENDSGIGARSHFCSKCKNAQVQVQYGYVWKFN